MEESIKTVWYPDYIERRLVCKDKIIIQVKGKHNFLFINDIKIFQISKRKKEFPDDWNVTYTKNHWSNEEKAMEHLEKVVFPYLKKQKAELKLTEDQKGMLIFDVFKGQVTEKVTKFIEQNDCVLVHVPSNMTDHFQPLDLNVNGHAKEFLKNKFECWYAKQVTDQIDSGRNVYDVNVPLKLSIIKPIHAKWLLGLYDYLKSSPTMIIKGFEMAGIKEAFEI